MSGRLKAVGLTLFTLCLGSLMLFADTGTATALGFGLIVLASTAIVTSLAQGRHESDQRSRRT